MSSDLDARQQLKQFAKDRSESSFAAVVRHYLPLVYHAALRQVRNEQLAEDISQAVFILLAEKAHTFSEGDFLPAWLYKATRYASANALRTENRRRKLETEAARMNDTATFPPEDWSQLSPALDKAMSRLGTHDRQLLLLRFFENLDVPELSDRLGISETAARKRLSRAIERLRATLESQSITASRLSLAALMADHFSPPVPEHLMTSIAASALSGAGKATALAATTASNLRRAECIRVGIVTSAVIVAVLFCTLTIWLLWSTSSANSHTTAAGVNPNLPAWAQQAADAYQHARCAHAVTHETFGQYTSTVETWLQQNPARAAVVYTRQNHKTFQIADGTYEWNFADIGDVVTRRAQTQSAAAQLELRFISDWWTTPNTQRDVSKDKSVGGVPLQAYSATDRWGTHIVWIDSNFLARESEHINSEYHADTQIEWNVDLPPECFVAKPPPGARIIDPVQYLEELYPLSTAVWSQQYGDVTAALHKFERGDDGLIYLVHSSRFSESARQQRRQASFEQFDALDRHVVPIADGEGGSWRSIPICRIQVCDVVVFYVVLIPQRDNLPNDRIDLVAINDARESRKNRFTLDVPLPANPQTVESFAAEAFNATDHFTSIIAPAGGIWTHPGNGLKWRPAWATDSTTTSTDLVDVAQRWSNYHWHR